MVTCAEAYLEFRRKLINDFSRIVADVGKERAVMNFKMPEDFVKWIDENYELRKKQKPGQLGYHDVEKYYQE